MSGEARGRAQVLRVGIVLVAWLLATSGARSLMAPDEGRYVGVALAMLHSGDWLVPRLDGLPFFHKPPLFYWIGAAAMGVAGPVEWAARLPSVLGASAAGIALFAFLRRWTDDRLALWSTVVLATMPYFFLGAQFANLDMLVAGCISATVLLAAWAVLAHDEGRPWRAALALAHAGAAAGLLAKGLIGLLLPFLVLAAWCAWTRRLATLWRLCRWLPGWALLLALAAPWFVAMQRAYPEFFDYFVITQHFRRFASSGFNNEQPFWFYLPVLAGLTLPWSLGLLLPRRGNAAPEPGAAARDVDRLMWTWLIVIVVFFSLPRSKLVGYVLPVLAPLACVVARRILASGPMREGRGLKAAAAAAMALCLAGVGTLVAMPQPGARLRLPADARIGPDDQVLMLDSYIYEIPFYWHLRAPVMVLGEWKNRPEPERDDWRKELADAARFDEARASRLLVDASRLPAILCAPRVTWLVGPNNSQLQHPWLAGTKLVAVNDRLAVWRHDGAARRGSHCAGLSDDLPERQP
ncbi:glycosyl transferase family 39 [Variovorax paradoxus]|uniref:ArnT family glycosyltransferase n=1 Tax=Variovorax paradoxus TaxID=34073 RepID=UPI0006E6BD24|nr:glycosyl transferase family 39 [Variovorax paradoxus]KPV10809.1 glycosyl transferase family 39 [Variovorax paradoxus]KPV10845.1 glycosyl transferase family 39 [Variovorax paradoxus]KPV11115.1 glycosyl transferase family 39 [Variovorax paradoxus]KPV24442.1 glycosyl transferase family 39 [Variovorax paradoxus]